jgi:hypothetical protein
MESRCQSPHCFFCVNDITIPSGLGCCIAQLLEKDPAKRMQIQEFIPVLQHHLKEYPPAPFDASKPEASLSVRDTGKRQRIAAEK